MNWWMDLLNHNSQCQTYTRIHFYKLRSIHPRFIQLSVSCCCVSVFQCKIKSIKSAVFWTLLLAFLSSSSWYEETAAPTGRQRDDEAVGLHSALTAFLIAAFWYLKHWCRDKYALSCVLRFMKAQKKYFLIARTDIFEPGVTHNHWLSSLDCRARLLLEHTAVHSAATVILTILYQSDIFTPQFGSPLV